MYIANLTAAELSKAHEAADYLLNLPVRLDPELAIKLDTFRADAGAELEDRSPLGQAADRTIRVAAE